MNTQIENYTNNKLNNFYANAKLDYNLNGSATTKIEKNEIKIEYTENGISNTWVMYFYSEYVTQNGLDYFFNVWMEETR
jgi:hypothetical protein